MKSVVNKILLVFMIYLVAAASFNGFFVKWAFNDRDYRLSFEHMYYETAHRPAIHRQLMIKVAKEIVKLIPDEPREQIREHLLKPQTIISHYRLATIDARYTIEYNIVYQMCFLCLLVSMFLWRKIFSELTGNKFAGTLAACCFALIFPLFETVGGYFYDFSELLFFTLATFFALRGNWIALIIISPIAEYNKESFLFFVLTLFPFLAVKLEKKRAAIVVIFSAFLSGLVYLYVSNLYAGNPGGSTEFHLWERIADLPNGWIGLEITYGANMGAGTFLPHILLIAWIVKNSWNELPEQWKNHIKLAAAINFPLYILFCEPSELRDLSMLYVGFLATLAVYWKNFLAERSD